MAWQDALKVGASVIVSLGGGGAIVFGLSGFLGNIWVQRLKGEIDAELQRLDAALKHRTFLLQRFAEFELEALAECWRAARACLPLINSTRPYDSGTDETALSANWAALSDGHNKLIEALGRHEVFLPDTIIDTLDAIGRILRGELSDIRSHPHFEGDWWEEGERRRNEFARLSGLLKTQVRERSATLRTESQEAR